MRNLKTYLRNGLTALMTFVFFVNITFAHSVDFHLCQGELQSIALFGQKATCSKMMELQPEIPRSCCDQQKNLSGLHVKPKSCCDNVQFVQDNLLAKPSIDLDHSVSTAYVFSKIVTVVSINLFDSNANKRKVEIPPPPNIDYQHSQEKLQVFII